MVPVSSLLRDDAQKRRLLEEVEQILRTMPTRDAFNSHDDATLPWLGRAAAAVERWDPLRDQDCKIVLEQITSLSMSSNATGFTRIRTLLHQVHSDLSLDVGATSVVVPAGHVFDYFDEVRKIIEVAREDLLFVDPYLDAEFVSRYLPRVAAGVSIRLLTGSSTNRLADLMPSVAMFSKQNGSSIQVRSSQGLHDRFVFVDRRACYLSGASFRDGALKATTVLTQIADAFAAIWKAYDDLWVAATVQK